jgi:hypothetical protein
MMIRHPDYGMAVLGERLETDYPDPLISRDSLLEIPFLS